MKCSFFLLFIFIFHCNCLKYIRYIIPKSRTIPSIRNFFNIQNVSIQSPISTALPYTCFINSDYHVKKIDRERAINEAKLDFENRTRDGLHFRDDIYKDDVKIIDNFDFFTVDLSSYHIYTLGYGFGYRYIDEHFSFVHSLYNQKKIDHKLFAFIPAKENEDGYFIIGGITDDLNYKYKGSLNVNKRYNTWGNTLKRISIGNVKYDINVYAQIHSSHYDIVTSKRFFNFILNTVLKEDIINKHCERLTEGFKKGMIECNRTVIENKKDITFEFENITFKFPFINCFDSFDSTSFSSFSYDTSLKEDELDDILYLGYPFIRQFNLTVFNYEDSSISFYSDLTKIITSTNVTSILLVTKIYNIAIITMFISLIHLLSMKLGNIK